MPNVMRGLRSAGFPLVARRVIAPGSLQGLARSIKGGPSRRPVRPQWQQPFKRAGLMRVIALRECLRRSRALERTTMPLETTLQIAGWGLTVTGQIQVALKD